jgi:hypothetical protein
MVLNSVPDQKRPKGFVLFQREVRRAFGQTCNDMVRSYVVRRGGCF